MRVRLYNFQLILCETLSYNTSTGSSSGSGDTVYFPCEFNQCPNTVIDFNVICSNKLLKVQWSAPDDSWFGFCIQYQCSTDPNLEYCTSETKQV